MAARKEDPGADRELELGSACESNGEDLAKSEGNQEFEYRGG